MKKNKKGYLLSTRISHWPLTEVSPERNEFRDLLTQHIRNGTHVKRIWQIQDADDAERLKTYLEIYKQYDNYNVKCFFGDDTYLPEIISANGKVAAVSLVTIANPRDLTVNFHFYGKQEIAYWEDLFNVMWEN